MRFVGAPHESLERSVSALEAAAEAERAHGCSLWRAELLDGDFVGCCGFHPFEGPRSRRRGTRWLELAYHLLPSFWGRGLAAEAAAACLAWATARAVTHVVAFAHPEHGASVAILFRLGFVEVEPEGGERRFEWASFEGRDRV